MNSTVKFGFITDTHFSAIRQNFRTDDFLTSVLSKLRQCIKRFNAEGCEFIIHGGDVFDKHRSYSFPMLLGVREALLESRVPVYFIWGQHDLLGYSRESSDKSSLEFLRQICDGKLIEIPESGLDLDQVQLIPSHADQDCVQVLQAIPVNPTKPIVAIVHALILDSESSFETIHVKSFGKIAPQLVLSGDLHCGFPLCTIEGTSYYNPGSLGRTSRGDRLPKAAIIELLPEGGVNIQEFQPECEIYPFPEKEEGAPVVNPNSVEGNEEYIEAFEKFRTGARDVIERLELVGKEKGIDIAILEYIKSMRNRASLKAEGSKS